MDYNSHHSLHYDTHIPIHHCTNHTAVTNHSLTLIVSPHLHLIHTHTYKQHTYMHSLRSLVLAPADIYERYHPAVCYLCVWPRTARPWNPEPEPVTPTSTCDPDFCLWPRLLPVTPTSAWYCLRLCPASDIPVCARWPLPVWLSIKYLTAHGSTRLWPAITIPKSSQQQMHVIHIQTNIFLFHCGVQWD